MHCRPLGRSRLQGEALSKLSEQLGELEWRGKDGAGRRRGTNYWYQQGVKLF